MGRPRHEGPRSSHRSPLGKRSRPGRRPPQGQYLPTRAPTPAERGPAGVQSRSIRASVRAPEGGGPETSARRPHGPHAASPPLEHPPRHDKPRFRQRAGHRGRAPHGPRPREPPAHRARGVGQRLWPNSPSPRGPRPIRPPTRSPRGRARQDRGDPPLVTACPWGRAGHCRVAAARRFSPVQRTAPASQTRARAGPARARPGISALPPWPCAIPTARTLRPLLTPDCSLAARRLHPTEAPATEAPATEAPAPGAGDP